MIESAEKQLEDLRFFFETIYKRKGGFKMIDRFIRDLESLEKDTFDSTDFETTLRIRELINKWKGLIRIKQKRKEKEDSG